MGDDGSWRTQPFRQCIVSKIGEAVRQNGITLNRNSLEMESHIFQKAKTKEEYLGYVARLILHFREINSKTIAGMEVPESVQGASGMPDAINALQTLAIRGDPPMTRGGPQQGPMGAQQQTTATNLLQTFNRSPGEAMNPNMQQNTQPRPNMGIGPNGEPLANQMNNQMGQIPDQMANQLGGQMSNNGVNQMPNQLGNQMQDSVQKQIGNQLPNQLPGQLQMGDSVQGGPDGQSDVKADAFQ